MKNVFTTEQEAIDAQAVDFQMYKNAHGEQPAEYWDVTKRWDNVQKRADAEEWFYEVCEHGVQTHTKKEAEPSWYPVEEV